MQIKFLGYTFTLEKTEQPEPQMSRQDYHKQGIWVTATGEKIHVSEMSINHLMAVWLKLYWRVDEFCKLHGSVLPDQVLEQIIIWPFICDELEKNTPMDRDLFLDEMPH